MKTWNISSVNLPIFVACLVTRHALMNKLELTNIKQINQKKTTERRIVIDNSRADQAKQN